MPDAVVLVDEISKTYRSAGADTKALDNVSLVVESNEFLGICGPSGSGKSTLLNIIAGLDKPDNGRVVLCGEDVNKLNDNQLTDFRRDNIGFVFQDYHLIETLSARANIALPLRLTKLNAGQIEKNVDTAMDLVGVADVGDKRARYLSGGQKQRVAIARALISDPAIIIADEPTGNLDRENAETALAILRSLTTLGKTVILATHDAIAAAACNRIVSLDKGRVIEEAPRQVVNV